ncbi:hypothetical protein DL95DRAFT_318854, partial [Leptodontidium sp. 2 PMI_412]
ALSSGFKLTLYCYFYVFSSNIIVALPKTQLAIIPSTSGIYYLLKIIRPLHTLDLILIGRLVRAREALLIGLCNRLVTIDL